MPPPVSANGLTLVHAESNGQLITTDVCNTTVGNSVVPIPYVNVAETADAAATARTVFVEGCPVCIETSRLELSRGDESGDQGGIVSAMREGEATFLAGSPDVFVEGVPVVRAFEQMLSNCENTSPAPLLQELVAPAMAGSADPIAGDEPLPQTAIEIAGSDQAPLPGELVIDSEQGDWYRAKALRWGEHDGQRWLLKAHELPAETGAVRLSLIDIDERHGFIKVPLTLGAKQPVWLTAAANDAAQANHAGNAGQGRQPTVLVPTLVRLYSRVPGERRSSACGFGGWVYLFWEQEGKRYLWRELWLDEHGMIREVNLAYERGDERFPSGQSRTVVILPVDLGGEQVKLSALYSAVQWPWAQVVRWGGLHPYDPRAPSHDQSAESADRTRLEIAAERLVDIDFSSYPDFTARSLFGTGPLGGCDEFVDAESQPGEPAPLREDLLPYSQAALPVLYLDDPLGQARWLAREQERYSCQLGALVASLRSGKAPEAGVDAAQSGLVYDVPDASLTDTVSDGSLDGGATAITDEEDTLEQAAQELHQVAATFYRLAFIDEMVGLGEVPPDRQFLEQLLAVEQRAELRRLIAVCRRRRLALFEQERYASALADYLDNTPRRTFAGIATLLEHCNDLAEPAAAADAHLLADEQLQADGKDLFRARQLLHALLDGPDHGVTAEAEAFGRLLKVGNRLLSEPVGVSGTCRGKGVPYSRAALVHKLQQAPPGLRELEWLTSLAEQRAAIRPEDGIKLLWKLIKAFAAPVSYEYPVLTPIAALQDRLNLPGTELVGPLEQQQRVLPLATLQGQGADVVQTNLVQAIKSGALDAGLEVAGERFAVVPTVQPEYQGLTSTATGHSRLWVLGNPVLAPNNRIAPGQTITELVVRREAPTRIADAAERLVQGPVGQAMRGYFGILELINLRSALTQIKGQAGIRQLLNAYIAASNSLNLIVDVLEAYQRRRWTVNHPQVQVLRQVVRRSAAAANALGVALSIFDGGRALLDRDHPAAVAAGVGVSLILLSMLLIYCGAAGLLVAAVSVIGSLALLAFDYLRDGPVGQLFRNGPFTAQVRQAFTDLLGADAAPQVWVRHYAEHGPLSLGTRYQQRWQSWQAIAAELGDILLAPPVQVVADHGRWWSVTTNSLRNLSITLMLPGFDWRAGDSIELRYFLREDCGNAYEIFDINPQIGICELINQQAATDAGEGLRLELEWRDLEMPERAMTLLVFVRFEGLTGSHPAPDSAGRPRYQAIAVSSRNPLNGKPYRVLTAGIEEVLDDDPLAGV